LAGTLKRRGVFLKKLAASDLEFFGSQAASLADRRRALAINTNVAEAVLPREARRRGIWTAPGRNFFGGDVEQLNLSRALDWQLSGITPEHRTLGENDWFAARYEVDDEGQIAFVWRTVAHNVENRLWLEIESNVSRHLVSGMVHFSAEHPEHDAVDAIVFRAPDTTEQQAEPVTQSVTPGLLDLADDPLIEPESPSVATPTPILPTAHSTKHVILNLSGGEVAQYYESRIVAPHNHEPELEPEAEAVEVSEKEELPVAISASTEGENIASETAVPLDIKALLKIDEASSPILLNSPEQKVVSEPSREEILPAANTEIPTFLSERSNTPKIERNTTSGMPWRMSAAALGVIVLAGLGMKNSQAVGAFACTKLGMLCAKNEAVVETKVVLPPPAPKEETVYTGSTQTVPPAPAIGGPLVAPQAATPPVDEVVWSILQDTKDPQQLQTFVSRFPSSSYRGDALARLAALEPRVTDCDVFAAHPLDQRKAAEVFGVKIQFINASLATQACERAVENFPNEVRFQLQLGRGYEKAKKYEEAHKWYAKAAELGYPQAMHNLGFQLATGQGVRLNYAEARKWFTMAAVLGNAAAMTNLGQLYANGLGVPRDYKEAWNWYMKAADAGVPLAMINLGWLYSNGRGVPRDYNEAHRWYKKAADLGSARAMLDLGSMYREGLGVNRNYHVARKWYVLAAENGSDDARKALVRLRR
jgi:hypothetical protein